MENQDLDLIGQTVGNMPYKIGIVDKDGKLTNQFVVNASTNRIDIPESSLEQNQLLPTVNLFSGSAVGNILLSGPTPNYDNVQDGLLITLSNQTVAKDYSGSGNDFMMPDNVTKVRMDLSSIGLKGIKIPKEKLVVGNSFDISDQLSQYIGQAFKCQYYESIDGWRNVTGTFSFSIESFGGTTIKILPNATLSMNLTVHGKSNSAYGLPLNDVPIPVIQVNTYKN